MSKILYIAQNNPWDSWSSSGFLVRLCRGLLERGVLYGALPYWAASEQHLLPNPWLDLKRRVTLKLGIRPKRNAWGDEREGVIGSVLRKMDPSSVVIYQYLVPEFDPRLPLRRFLFQDLTVFDAVRTQSYGHAGFTDEDVRRKADAHRRALAQAEGVLTFSTYAADSIARDFGYPRERITAIGCGPVRSHASRCELTPERYAAARILFVGREWERKGGPVALEAFKHVRNAIPHATLHVVGPQESLPAEPGVHYHGRVSDATVSRLFAAASMFTMPAICEAWGIVYVEAADSGLPIAGFNAWAMPDIVADGETGRLTDDQTPEGLAKVMIEMLRHPQRMLEMGRLAQRRVREVHDWPHVVERLLYRVSPGRLNGRVPSPLRAVRAR